jgi:ADP-ribose pyrophosphatase YjhB (NUDIX family)
MLTLGVNIAIIHSGQILLIKREDFEVWGLPGGHVDPGESVAQAAVREAWEETGLEVELTKLVGVYSALGGRVEGNHVVLFRAQPVGGILRPDESEVIELNYFDPAHLPEPLIWWHHQRILDAMNGVGGGVAWAQKLGWPFAPEVTRDSIYQLRDQSGLSRQAFYQHYFGQEAVSRDETLEVDGKAT